MTTPSTSRKAGPLLGTGSQTTWPFTFKVFAATDIAVTIADSLGVETALVYGVDFNVTLNANQETSPGGTVTYPISGAALPVGKRLVIVGNLPYDQPLDLPSGGNFSPLALENQLDRTVMQIQQLREDAKRAVKAPVSDATVDMTMPVAAERANRYLSFDLTGRPVATTFDIDAIQNASTAAVAAAGAAAQSEANAAGSEANATSSAAQAAASASLTASQVASVTPAVVRFSGDGVETDFTLPSTPGAEENTLVFIGGVYQQKDQYSVTGTTLAFSEAPPAGTANIEVQIGPAIQLLVASALTTSYQPAGIGAVPTNVQDKLRQMVSAVDFGADPTGAADSSAAITAALAAASHVVVPPGTYRCDTMIELGTSKTLQLMGGATLRRFAAHSVSTDPVVWIKGSAASFFGAGQASSTVITENRAPKGVVRLGHKDMTESHGNVTYCTLMNMTISGAVIKGQTTGAPDVALYMPNPQFSGLASYFHNIFGLRVQNANFGIWLNGWANANTISNIQGYRLGNITLGVNTNAFIYCNGALDNAISNCFFHASSDSIGLLVDSLDNTGGGGNLHEPYANSFSGMVFEQGGAAALGVKSLITGGNSFYEIRHNTAGGNSLPAGFTENNVFIGLTNVSARAVTGSVRGTFGELVADTSLLGGATSDGVNVQKIAGGQAIGSTSQRTYTATGTITITVKFGTTLVGAVWRSGLVELMFDGFTSGGGSRQAARYYIPISGLTAWNLGTPVAIYGSGLTITQTANSTTSVTFTVVGAAGADGRNSIFATATSNIQARLE